MDEKLMKLLQELADELGIDIETVIEATKNWQKAGEKMEYEYSGLTIDELIAELEELKLNLGSGDIEVTLPQVADDDEAEWNAHISFIQTGENELGETIVKIY
jgi:hypothetical protein